MAENHTNLQGDPLGKHYFFLSKYPLGNQDQCLSIFCIKVQSCKAGVEIAETLIQFFVSVVNYSGLMRNRNREIEHTITQGIQKFTWLALGLHPQSASRIKFH